MALAGCAAVPPAPPLSSSTLAVTFSQIDFGPRAAMASELWTAVNRVASAHSLEGTPFQEGGNFLTATWCPSAALERCSRGFVSDSGMTRAEVMSTLDRHEAQVCTVGAQGAVPPPCPGGT